MCCCSVVVMERQLFKAVISLSSSFDAPTEQQHIFPIPICQRIILKLDNILIPSLHSIPFPGLTSSSIEVGAEDMLSNEILLAVNKLRQNLILIRGNVQIVEKQLSVTYTLSMVKELDPYYLDRLEHILDLLNIAAHNAQTTSDTFSYCPN